MRIPHVEIENFLAIGEANFSLDGLGLVHISGDNKDETSADSNGSGKSSLGDAISWCLWGSTARGVSGDDIVNVEAGKNARVYVTIEDDNEKWQVRRYRKYAKHRNALQLWRHDGNDWVNKTKGTNSLTQAAIERLMGCSEDVFNAAVYNGQEAMPDIPAMTDLQLKRLVEQAAGVDVLTIAYEIAKERLRERQQVTADAQIALDRAIERRDDAEAGLKRLQQQHEQWEQEHDAKLKRLKHDTTQAVADYEVAKNDLDAEAKAEVERGIKECEDNIAAVNDEREREALLQSDFDEAKQVLSRAEAGEAIAERNTKQANNMLVEANDLLEKTREGKDAVCNMCRRPYDGEHLKKAIERAEAKVTAAEAELRAFAEKQVAASKKVKAAHVAVEKAGKSLKDHRAAMTDVSAEGDRLRNLKRELQVIHATEQEVDRVKQRAIRIGDQYKEEKRATNPFVDLLTEADAELIKRTEAIGDASKARDAARVDEQYAQAVADVYAPAGVRAHRLDEATPYLNERTAHYLGSLADGAIEAFWTTVSENKGKTKLLEKFSVTVEKPGGAPSFKNLSGGEKRKVRLACALALQDLVATRATKSIELMVLDEIDDALDAAGLERLMGILEEKARDRGTVMVISHNDIAAYARRHWRVEKTNGRAVVHTL